MPNTAEYFAKWSLIIFLLHLAVVGAFCAFMVVAYELSEPDVPTEAPALWVLFYVINYPVMAPLVIIVHSLATVFPPLEAWANSPYMNPFPSPFLSPRLNYYWDWVIFPGCLFQIVGWINWTIIWGMVRWVFNLFRTLIKSSSEG